MSFLNQEVDENICNKCRYRNSPYMSSSGVYSLCIDCIKGSNLAKKLTRESSGQEKVGDIWTKEDELAEIEGLYER